MAVVDVGHPSHVGPSPSGAEAMLSTPDCRYSQTLLDAEKDMYLSVVYEALLTEGL